MMNLKNKGLAAVVFTGLLLQSGVLAASQPTPPPTALPVPGPLALVFLGGAALLITRRFTRNK